MKLTKKTREFKAGTFLCGELFFFDLLLAAVLAGVLPGRTGGWALEFRLFAIALGFLNVCWLLLEEPPRRTVILAGSCVALLCVLACVLDAESAPVFAAVIALFAPLAFASALLRHENK